MSELNAVPASMTPQPSSASRFSSDNEEFPYRLYKVVVDYHFDSGKREMGVGDEEGGNEIVQVHGPRNRKTLAFHVERQGKKPELPDPTPPSGEDSELLTAVITPHTPSLSADGVTWIYVVEGLYTYALRSSKLARNNYHVPTVPYIVNPSIHEHNIPAAAFKETIS
jgi:hypothetical protein